jgi:integrase
MSDLDRIDTAGGMITIDQQVIVVGRRPVLAAPKTSASLRDVPMPRLVLRTVQEHADAFGLGNGDVLCWTPRGTLLRRDYYNKNIWKPAIAAVGLGEDTTFHDLRHTFASTALAGGVPVSEVSRWLGRKPITTTVDLYRHPSARGRRPCPRRAGQGARL